VEGAFDAQGLTGSMAGKTIPELAAVVLAGQTYVNVDTKAYPNGEIRGQIIVTSTGTGTQTTDKFGAELVSPSRNSTLSPAILCTSPLATMAGLSAMSRCCSWR
jgi:hypothetical protein